MAVPRQSWTAERMWSEAARKLLSDDGDDDDDSDGEAVDVPMVGLAP